MNGFRRAPLLAIACGILAAVAGALAQSGPTSETTPAEIKRPQPSAKATKNAHAPHHHFDTRHPHRSTRPQLQNPQTAPD